MNHYRWTILALGFLIAAVFWQSYAGRVDLVSAQRTGCLRGTADRIAEARKNAADGIREQTLAALPGPVVASRVHAVSADEAAWSAFDLLSRSGVNGIGNLAQLLRDVHADTPRIVAARHAFCVAAFPAARPLP